MNWLGDDDILKIKELEKKTLLEYFFLLNKKVEDAKKEASRSKPGNNQHRGRTGTH